jgi:hypothetical protein
MEYNLEQIKDTLRIKYLNNLLTLYKKNSNEFNIIKKNINKYDNTVYDLYTATEKNVESEKVSESEKIDYLYLKPWTKLTLIHKIIKIKEFINNLEINDTNKKEILKDELIEIMKNKKIKNKINYDEVNGKILSISNLAFENNTYILKY